MLRETPPPPEPPRYPRRGRPGWLKIDEPEGEKEMGFIFADLILSNADDVATARRGFIKPEEIRSLQVTALVDTGAYTLGLPEEIAVQLGLPEVEKREFDLADGSKKAMSVVGPVWVRFKNRQTVCLAVKTHDEEVLLGSIPLEDMDVVLNPRAQTIEVNPESPYLPKMKLK
jgi:clan AA aspartic protease